MARDLDKILTKRLILRGINETDAVEIVEWRSDPDVYRYFKSPHKITIKEHFAWYNNNYLNNENRMDWMCIEKGTGKKIGVFGLGFTGKTAEVNYLLALDARHKGYASEALMYLVEYATERCGARHIIAEIHKDNIPSVLLIIKQGFILEERKGDFEIYGKAGE